MPLADPAPVVTGSPNWLCRFETKCGEGRLSFGPSIDYEGCVNRIVTCVKCARTGEESINTERRATAPRAETT